MELPFDLFRTPAMTADPSSAIVWQCSECGALVAATGVKFLARTCPACCKASVTWWRQGVPVGPFHAKGALAAAVELVDAVLNLNEDAEPPDPEGDHEVILPADHFQDWLALARTAAGVKVEKKEKPAEKRETEKADQPPTPAPEPKKSKKKSTAPKTGLKASDFVVGEIVTYRQGPGRFAARVRSVSPEIGLVEVERCADGKYVERPATKLEKGWEP